MSRHNPPSQLNINLRALQKNYALLQSRAPHAEIAGVVKANAYGLGAAAVTEALYATGCRTFFTAHFDEALRLRDLYPDIHLYALNGLMTAAPADFIAANVTPVLNNRHDIYLWQKTARAQQNTLPAALHFDTGMNRLGLGHDETAAFLTQQADDLDGLHLDLIMSHFACADEQDHPLTARQAASFARLAVRFPTIRASLCNSAGVFSAPDHHHDLIRAGLALYGGNPTPYTHNPMADVVTLQARILHIQTVPASRSVGYGATYHTTHSEELAIVCLGYADGFFRNLGTRGRLYWRGQACPLRGRISMDLTTVSLSGINGAPPQIGDMMDVICPQNTISDIAASIAGGGLDYEVLTALGTRYHRNYINVTE